MFIYINDFVIVYNNAYPQPFTICLNFFRSNNNVAQNFIKSSLLGLIIIFREMFQFWNYLY